MRYFLQAALSVACASTAFGQLDSYTVTVTATRPLTLAPDQVGISVEVTAPVSTDVLSLVQSAGITLANLSSSSPDTIRTGPRSVAAMDWYFAVTVPLANLNSTLSTYTNLQQTVAQRTSGGTLSFSITGLQISPQLQSSQQCPLADLMADARSQAQLLAQAAGFTLGEVSAISNAPLPSAQGATTPVIVDFAVGAVLLGTPYELPATTSSSCVVSVTFKVASVPGP